MESRMNGRERILDAAEKLFEEKGFDGSSIREVAERAGVAKSLLYHHFSSKRDLWREVVHRVFERHGLREKVTEFIDNLSPDRFMEFSCGPASYFGFLRNNPGFARMLSWLDAERRRLPYEETGLRDKAREKLAQLQSTGVIRDDIDPRMLMVIYMGACEHWFSSAERISALFSEPLEQVENGYVEALSKILLDGATRR
ncbi:TetR family transcriptional regulator [Candidatus Fermentibacteria bacterium]|nr:TetR family transcriptional regulator [Candidatus Fermentibacteria bacterium]